MFSIKDNITKLDKISSINKNKNLEILCGI